MNSMKITKTQQKISCHVTDYILAKVKKYVCCTTEIVQQTYFFKAQYPYSALFSRTPKKAAATALIISPGIKENIPMVIACHSSTCRVSII